MFLIQIEVSELFNIFSKYTPLNPLLIQATDTASSPNSFVDEMKLADSLFAAEEGHCNKEKTVLNSDHKSVRYWS